MLDTGFKSRLLDDILYRVSDCTTQEATELLDALSYSGELMLGAKSFALEEIVSTYSHGLLAEYVDNITFRGGPSGETWYTGTLQSVVTDWVLQCCKEWGSESVAFVLGITNG